MPSVLLIKEEGAVSLLSLNTFLLWDEIPDSREKALQHPDLHCVTRKYDGKCKK